jgi:hypothetical protein
MQKLIFLLIPFLLLLLSCEEEYIPKDVFDKAEISVEGYIEYGDSALPPYVILTKSFPYSSTLSPEALNELFIHDAIVKVSDGTTEIQLTEICLNDILSFDSTLANMIASSIGLGGIDLGTLNYCVYVDIGRFLGTSALVPTIGNSYYLTVISEGDTVTATTTIPPLIPLDSVFYVNHPDFPSNDSLVEIRATLRDFPNRADYYRIFTKRNSEPMFALLGGSVTDDKIFDGIQFVFPIQRGQPQTAEFDQNTFGYFWRGDTVIVRSSNLDFEHFRFWQTLEYNIGTQGPFTSYVRIESNIKGGLGIWGGLSFGDYKIIVQ